jgi:hypothetical protein
MFSFHMVYVSYKSYIETEGLISHCSVDGQLKIASLFSTKI